MLFYQIFHLKFHHTPFCTSVTIHMFFSALLFYIKSHSCRYFLEVRFYDVIMNVDFLESSFNEFMVMSAAAPSESNDLPSKNRSFGFLSLGRRNIFGSNISISENAHLERRRSALQKSWSQGDFILFISLLYIYLRRVFSCQPLA